MAEVTISSNNQIVIPREVREKLGVKAGDKLIVVVQGDRVFAMQKPKSYRAAITGMPRGLSCRIPGRGAEELGLEVLRSFLRRHRKIALDTSVFIYQTEANPKYLPVTNPVFNWLA